MNCDIIKDLLPLYAEDLCRPDSRAAVEEHLKTCESCRQEYTELRQDYLSQSENQNEEQFLEEKDLLEKSKEELRHSFINKLMGKVFTAAFVLGLLINAAMVVVTLVMYRCQYPKLYFKELGSAQVWLLILPFVPTVLALAGRLAVLNSKKYKLFSVLWLTMLIPAGFCSLFFMIIPPVSSATANLNNYLKVDGAERSSERFESAVKSFCPEQIPDSAKQADYFYERYASFFSENIQLKASWVLPEAEYDAVKQKTLKLKQFKNSSVSESGGNGIIVSTLYPENVSILFEYRDAERRVTYRADTNQNY